MGMYKGTPMKEWKCGIVRESNIQKYHLNDSRIKHLAKIHLSDIYILKDVVLTEVLDYAHMYEVDKPEIRKSSFDRISVWLIKCLLRNKMHLIGYVF